MYITRDTNPPNLRPLISHNIKLHFISRGRIPFFEHDLGGRARICLWTVESNSPTNPLRFKTERHNQLHWCQWNYYLHMRSKSATKFPACSVYCLKCLSGHEKESLILTSGREPWEQRRQNGFLMTGWSDSLQVQFSVMMMICIAVAPQLHCGRHCTNT